MSVENDAKITQAIACLVFGLVMGGGLTMLAIEDGRDEWRYEQTKAIVATLPTCGEASICPAELARCIDSLVEYRQKEFR
jgi:hypothetical protein